MSVLNVYDGSSAFRARIEYDPTNFAANLIIQEMLNPPAGSVHVWVWDGPRNNAKRRALYPEYKAKRKPMAENIFATMEGFKEALKHTNAIQICVPEFEADDVVHSVVKQNYRHFDQIVVHSKDFDLWQIASISPDRILVTAPQKVGIPPERVRLYKACVGDPSDNIPGIKLFGPKAWEEGDPKELLDFMLGYKEEADLIAMPDKCRGWLRENTALVRTFYEITGLMDVPDGVMAAHQNVGVPNKAEAEAIIKQFML
jgi:hypothetical protein